MLGCILIQRGREACLGSRTLGVDIWKKQNKVNYVILDECVLKLVNHITSLDNLSSYVPFSPALSAIIIIKLIKRLKNRTLWEFLTFRSKAICPLVIGDHEIEKHSLRQKCVSHGQLVETAVVIAQDPRKKALNGIASFIIFNIIPIHLGLLSVDQ
jgi:hypothetical protein